MSPPFILWAATRSGSTTLCHALGAEDEPFQPDRGRLAWVYDRWRENAAEAIMLLGQEFISGRVLKHIPEDFEDGFNIAIAHITTSHGYRHVHLVRRDEQARLISLDIAGQLDAWSPADFNLRRAELRRGERVLQPLDVPRLIENSKRVKRAWTAVESFCAPVLTVICEDITARCEECRFYAIVRLMVFLGLPMNALKALDHAMRTGGQDSGRLRDLLPNIWELRVKLGEET